MFAKKACRWRNVRLFVGQIVCSRITQTMKTYSFVSMQLNRNRLERKTHLYSPTAEWSMFSAGGLVNWIIEDARRYFKSFLSVCLSIWRENGHDFLDMKIRIAIWTGLQMNHLLSPVNCLLTPGTNDSTSSTQTILSVLMCRCFSRFSVPAVRQTEFVTLRCGGAWRFEIFGIAIL